MSASSSNPRVSVIVPVYNRADAVRAAATSVLGQTYRDFELILVDDGSTDGSARVVDDLCERNPSLVRCIHQENSGVASARNHGITLSRGEYICFLDSDDEWLPEKLAIQVEFMDRHPEVALSYVWALIVDAQGRALGRIASKAGRNTYRKLFYLNPIAPTSGTMVLRKVLDEVGVFDIGLRTRQDWDLWFRIARHHAIRDIPQALVRYLSAGTGISANLAQTEKDNRAVLQRALERDRQTGGPMYRHERRVLAFLSLRLAYIYLQRGDSLQFRSNLHEVFNLYPMILIRHPRVALKCLLATLTARI